MSHQLEVVNGEAAFFSLREEPWHKLGQVVDTATSITEALELAHLTGWNVRKTPLTTTVEHMVDGQLARTELVVPDNYAVVRDNPFVRGQVDLLAGSVGAQYTVVQNEETADVLDAVLRDSGAHIETAGSLKGGTEVFVTMKLPETMMVGGQDPVDTYIAAMNTHHGQKAFRFIVTPVRVVCANTQAAAVRSATASFSRRHTKNGLTAIEQRAREALGLAYKAMEEFQAEADKMIDQAFTDAEFEKLTAELYRAPDSASDLIKRRVENNKFGMMSLYKDSPTAKDIRGTKWGAYQAVTEYLDHFAEFKGYTGEKASEYRALSAIDVSDSQKRKSMAFAYLTK